MQTVEVELKACAVVVVPDSVACEYGPDLEEHIARRVGNVVSSALRSMQGVGVYLKEPEEDVQQEIQVQPC